MPRHKVMVDDNFHYHEPDERREHGVCETADQAIAACQEIVDRSLEGEHRPGISAPGLCDRYMNFGDDPFTVVLDGADDRAKFSAYAMRRSTRVICTEP